MAGTLSTANGSERARAARPVGARAAQPRVLFVSHTGSMSGAELVLLPVDADGVATIAIDRPKVMNAFRGRTCEELIHAFNRAGWDKAVGVIVLTGTGAAAAGPPLDAEQTVRVVDALRRAQRLCAKPALHRPGVAPPPASTACRAAAPAAPVAVTGVRTAAVPTAPWGAARPPAIAAMPGAAAWPGGGSRRAAPGCPSECASIAALALRAGLRADPAAAAGNRPRAGSKTPAVRPRR